MHHTTISCVRRRALGLFSALLLLLGACASGGNEAQPAGPGDTTASEINRSGTVHLGWDLIQTNAGFSLDPAETPVSTPPNDPLWFLVYGRLMRPTADGGLEPELAQSVTLVDSQTIQIELRPNLTWQDGSVFDAEAVKTGLQRTLDSGATGLDKNFFTLQSMEVTSPTNLNLHFSAATAASWLDSFIGSWETTIVKPGTDFTAPIGAGPMRMTGYRADQRITLERWDGYWNADAVNFARMELVQLAQSQVATSGVSALQSGQFDFVASDVAVHDTLGGNLVPITVPDPNRLVSMQLCKRDAPISDSRVRTAMAKAIDRQALSDAVYSGTAVPGVMLWPEGHRFYTEADVDALAYDPEGAKKLLAEAGYPDGFSFDLYPVSGVNLPTAAEVIKELLAAVDIKANIVPVSNYVGEFLEPKKPGAGLTPGGTAGTLKLTAFYGQNLGNVCLYEDATMESLASQLNLVSDQSDEAVKLWNQANDYFTEQALSVPLLFSARLAAYNSDRMHVEDLWPKGFNPMPNVYTAYMRAN